MTYSHPLKSIEIAELFSQIPVRVESGFQMGPVNYGQLPRRRARQAIKAWLSKFAKTFGDCPNWRTISWSPVVSRWRWTSRLICWSKIHPIWISNNYIYIENSVLILNPIISLFHLFSLWVSISSPLNKSTINVKWLGAWPTASGFSGPLSGDKTQLPKGGRATRALENLDHVARLSSCLRSCLQRNPGHRAGFGPGSMYTYP